MPPPLRSPTQSGATTPYRRGPQQFSRVQVLMKGPDDASGSGIFMAICAHRFAISGVSHQCDRRGSAGPVEGL